MPSSSEHQIKINIAGRARKCLADDSSSHNDWLVTIFFYKALHAVDKYLAIYDIHPMQHVFRNQIVNIMEDLRPIRDAYNTLLVSSRIARYHGESFDNKPKATQDIIQKSDQVVEYIDAWIFRFQDKSLLLLIGHQFGL